MNKILRTTLATIAAAIAATSLALAAVTVPAGSTLNAVMDTSLNTSNAYVGQRFTMHLTAPYPAYSLQGAYLSGHVLAVAHASQGRKPRLQLAIDELVLRDGTSVDVDAQVTSMQQQTTESNRGHSVLTAVGGMFAGNMIGKTLFHSAAGGPIGLVGGALIGLNAKTNFTVPAGARVNVQTLHTIVVRQQSHH